MKELFEWQEESLIEFRFLSNFCHELKKEIQGLAGLRWMVEEQIQTG